MAGQLVHAARAEVGDPFDAEERRLSGAVRADLVSDEAQPEIPRLRGELRW